MKTAGKALLYLVLAVVAAWCFTRFRATYSPQDTREKAFSEAAAVEAAAEVPATPASNPPAPAELPGSRPAPVQGSPGSTSATEAVLGPGPGTNVPVVAAPPPGKAPGRRQQAVAPLAGFVAALLGLALMAGWDITQALAGRAALAMGAEGEAAPISDPEYEAAEQEWAKGNHLDAIGMMRGYLQRHPNEQHVAIRIAEIYEKDLQNHLAAALELEEVLTRRLPREKWGWTAVHLANIYSGKLHQPEKALAVLERIVREYPDTAAARKARHRLGIPEPTVPIEAPSEGGAEAAPAEPPEEPGLPRGFRARKR